MDKDAIVEAVTARSDRVERALVRIARLVGVALVVATALVPMAQVVSDDDDPAERYTARGLVVLITEPEKAFLDDDDESAADSAHPIAIPGGLLLTRIGLGLLAVGAIGTGLSALFLIDSGGRRDRIILRVSAGTLLAAAVLLTLGLAWLPMYEEDDIGPAWGVGVAALAGLWVLSAQLQTDEGVRSR